MVYIIERILRALKLMKNELPWSALFGSQFIFQRMCAPGAPGGV